MAKINLDKLERLANAATEGNWVAFTGAGHTNAILLEGDSHDAIIQWNGFDSSEQPRYRQKANAKYIAAAQPSVVLAMVSRIRELENGAK